MKICLMQITSLKMLNQLVETVNTTLENYSSEFESDFSTSDSNVTSDSDYIV